MFNVHKNIILKQVNSVPGECNVLKERNAERVYWLSA